MTGSVCLPLLTCTDDGCLGEGRDKLLQKLRGIVHICIQKDNIGIEYPALPQCIIAVLIPGRQLHILGRLYYL